MHIQKLLDAKQARDNEIAMINTQIASAEYNFKMIFKLIERKERG